MSETMWFYKPNNLPAWLDKFTTICSVTAFNSDIIHLCRIPLQLPWYNCSIIWVRHDCRLKIICSSNINSYYTTLHSQCIHWDNIVSYERSMENYILLRGSEERKACAECCSCWWSTHEATRWYILWFGEVAVFAKMMRDINTLFMNTLYSAI